MANSSDCAAPLPRLSESRNDPFQNQLGALRGLQWLPDGRTLVYAGEDGKTLLVDSTTGIPVASRCPPFATVATASLALLPGLRSGEAIRERDIYPLQSDDWLARACAVAGRNLTPEEWKTYGPAQPYQATCSNVT